MMQPPEHHHHQPPPAQQWVGMQYPDAAAAAAAAMALQNQMMGAVAAPPPAQYGSRYLPYHPPPPPVYRQFAPPFVPASGLGPQSGEENKSIWVGDLHYWMDENYLHSCFGHTGELVSIKVIRNKLTGQSEGYGFVEFCSRAVAEKVLQTFNGHIMPNAEHPFRLNWASFSMGDKRSDATSDHSIFVGDLAPDVTDTMLQETFASKYPSVKGAKVVIDANTGRSKGYGFVRFGDDSEKTNAMTEMSGVYCSSRPMRIGAATPRKSSGFGSNGSSAQGFQSVENKSWLLAEARGEPSEAEPQSVNSSFRFSFGSQAEAELDAPPASAATVLLLVSMEDEKAASAQRREQDPVKLASVDWQRSLERSIVPVADGLVRFSYAQIRSATRDFYRGRELGRGALSRVYKGRIGNGLRRPAVAIKRVDGPERESAKAFCRELLIANSLCSAHVVPLLGYCIDKEGLFLVYKYISGGSLDRHLHQNEKRPKVLAWEVRYKVAVGVARAVEYLHFCTDKCVVHRDIKPSNILLSSKKRPMLCDFGLATWTHGPSLPFLCKAVKGTFGYLAPEYFQNGKLSDKTDVYAFGVVLLELITGRKALDQSRPQGDENLVVWAKPLLRQGEDAIEKLVDPKLVSYRRREMYRMVQAANACLSCEDSTRPSIDLVLAMLLGEEGTACSEWSLFSGNGCLAGYGSQFHETHEKRDMGGHLALAMLGISDNEEDDSYGR